MRELLGLSQVLYLVYYRATLSYVLVSQACAASSSLTARGYTEVKKIDSGRYLLKKLIESLSVVETKLIIISYKRLRLQIRKMTRYCCVCHAEQSEKNSHLIFHRFPVNPEKRKQWLKVLNQDETKGLVCSLHFKSEDYREWSKKPLLKTDAIPNLSSRMIDTDGRLIGNYEQISEHIPLMEPHKKTENSIHYDNIENAPREFTISNDSDTNLTRTKDICDKSTGTPKKYCYIKRFGTFRKEDFTDENKWNRFVRVCNELRKENLLLQRKNERLLTKIQTFNDIIEELKEKKLITDSVAQNLSHF